MRILLIDDETTVGESIGGFLRERGYDITYVASPAAGLEQFAREAFELVITDIRMPGVDGINLLRRIKEMNPQTEVIIITGHGTMEHAVEALRAGAADFLNKPVDLRQLMFAVDKAARLRRLQAEKETYRDTLARVQGGGEARLIGIAPAMQQVRALTDKVAQSPATTVLITGESGTGKELVARMLHRGSARAQGPFIAVNCSAFPPNLIESELFGHEKGAFTGADAQRKGVIELAHGETLFLDEIGDMPVDLQGRLLRALEDRSVRRVGGSRDLPVDIRLVSATHRDLGQLVQEKRFREDLYFRLRVMVIPLPPLRERRDDIPLLTAHFTRQIGQQLGRRIIGVAPDVLDDLRDYPWPGNVRELRNMIEQAIILCEGETLAREHFPLLCATVPAASETLADLEMQRIRDAVRAAGGNLKAAAQRLGIGYGALRYRLKDKKGTQY